MQHARAMHVVEFETLYLRAVHQRSVRRGEFQMRAPHVAGARRIHAGERVLQYPAPRKVGAVERAAERIEHQQFDACFYLGRYRIVGEAGHKLRDAAGVGIIVRCFVTHQGSR